MDKVAFLLAEYRRIMASDSFVSEAWRMSEGRFLADLLDRVPSGRKGRFLAPRDPELGYSRDNVEWHFERPKVVLKPVKVEKPKVEKKPRKPKKIPAAVLRKLEREQARQEKRQKLAEEFKRWNRLRTG